MHNRSRDDGYKHIFISPHFDDAILSCGGLIHQLVMAGQSVCVMTMMAGLYYGDTGATPILEDLHERWQAGDNPLLTRQYEDRDAIDAIGASYVHVPLVDCVYRNCDDVWLYPTEDSLFADVHPEDYAQQFLSDIGVPFRESVKVVYVPLGVGHHVDHQIVRDWGLTFLDERPEHIQVQFYAEYPYLNTDNAIEQALSYFSISLTPNNVILDEDDIKAKVDAIACYKSQISTFWTSLEAMEDDVRQSSTYPPTGEYVERFWEISQ